MLKSDHRDNYTALTIGLMYSGMESDEMGMVFY